MLTKEITFFLFVHKNTLCLTSDPIDGLMSPDHSKISILLESPRESELDFKISDLTDYLLKQILENDTAGAVEYRELLKNISYYATEFFTENDYLIGVKKLTFSRLSIAPISYEVPV